MVRVDITMKPRPCLVCHEPTHRTYQHVDEPVWDLDIAALAVIVVGMMGLAAVILTSTIPH